MPERCLLREKHIIYAPVDIPAWKITCANKKRNIPRGALTSRFFVLPANMKPVLDLLI
jgi:hypothetical protein